MNSGPTFYAESEYEVRNRLCVMRAAEIDAKRQFTLTRTYTRLTSSA